MNKFASLVIYNIYQHSQTIPFHLTASAARTRGNGEMLVLREVEFPHLVLIHNKWVQLKVLLKFYDFHLFIFECGWKVLNKITMIFSLKLIKY